MHKLLSLFDKTIPSASAHCDIPCGIYDPAIAQIAALTAIRMIDQINELAAKGELSLADQAKLGRLVAEKESHCNKAKEEIRIIWGDYFKAPQFEKFPGTHELAHNIMLQGSKVRQHIDRDMAVEFLNLINEFAENFWATKGVETYTATCPYAPAEQVVYPKLA
ncbi:superoxide dismutase, Ni [uncultured Pseudoteredinibacter sp.]|uniref:superoxide dismutase, Ni n=1 Tax=uncultured Pseudoteredinibacter sp. TaxID=1641701 RepID=UPI00263912B2|nr:superoxide dismutase, Ni [uncultured Pseudoteredinibacter sp.]MCV6621258.1 superoxide dismutase, Ni [Cellvibrionaceae bacterium]